jgi:hypothetical protein
MLCLLERLAIFQNLRFEISNLKLTAEGIARQIRAWVESLQNSEIKGQRYLNEKGRRVSREKKDEEDFRKEIEHILEIKRKGSGEASPGVKG